MNEGIYYDEDRDSEKQLVAKKSTLFGALINTTTG